LVSAIKKDVRIGYVYLHQDDPAKSTMKKLQKFKMAEQINRDRMGGYVVLRYDADRT
jgi:pre-rRNA-processing protein TSR3